MQFWDSIEVEETLALQACIDFVKSMGLHSRVGTDWILLRRGRRRQRRLTDQQVVPAHALVEVLRAMFITTPNVELTGPRRHGALAVRPMMNQGGRAAWVPCRSGSG